MGGSNKLIEEDILCADIGGSHITAAMVNAANQTVISGTIVRQKIDAHAAADVVIDAWVAVLIAAQEGLENSCKYLAVSMPGPFDYKNGISLIRGMNKYDALFGMDIKQKLADSMAIPTDCIWFMNDAEAFLRGELCQDSAKHHERVLGLTLGTGLGSAFLDQGIVTDLNLGSSPFLDGIAEDYISSRGVLKYYRSTGGTVATDVKTMIQGIDADSNAKAAIGQLANWLADFLLKHVPILNPDRIIIGGNISQAHTFFLPEVWRTLDRHGMYIPIRVASMGEEAAMLGAASIVNLKIASNGNFF